MTLYLLDANSFITLSHTYYGFDQVPEYWEWLDHQAETGLVKTPPEIWNELNPNLKGIDEVSKWAGEKARADRFKLPESADIVLIRVVHDIYRQGGDELSVSDLSTIGRDPFLIAAALKDKNRRCVVSCEVSKPSSTRQNRKVPDVCKELGVECIMPKDFIRLLNFRTSWKSES